MTHNRMLDRVPSVSISSKRNELKVYQGNFVYLNDGDNFELRFFNPTNEKIGVEINFNGIKKGDGYLVLNPGQDIILDRFLDEQRKMLFETYVVDGNNRDAVKAIEKNGKITFNFYKERGSYEVQDVNINYAFPPKPYKYNANHQFKGMNSGSYGISGSRGVSGVSGHSCTSGMGGSSTTYTNNVYSTFTSPGVYLSQSDLSYTNTSNFSGSLTSGSITKDSLASYSIPNPLETGRIEMGEMSNQQLKSVNAQFNPNSFHTITYQLLPYSELNHTIKEVREYCGFCSYRLRNNKWSYCPKCGEKIN